MLPQASIILFRLVKSKCITIRVKQNSIANKTRLRIAEARQPTIAEVESSLDLDGFGLDFEQTFLLFLFLTFFAGFRRIHDFNFLDFLGGVEFTLHEVDLFKCSDER